MFIHTRIRLFCELHRAERWLTHQDFLKKWLMEDADQYEVIEVEPRERIEALWTSREAASEEFRERVVFHLMHCASRTQYCTEIHVVVHPDPDRCRQEDQSGTSAEDLTGKTWQAKTLTLWKQRLETLRQCVNGDWVIEDRDLNRSALLKSRL